MRYIRVASSILFICFASMMWAQSPPDITGTSNVGLIDYMTSTRIANTPITLTFADLADMNIGPCLNEDSLVKIDVSFVIKPSSVPHFELRVLYDGTPNVTLPPQHNLQPGSIAWIPDIYVPRSLRPGLPQYRGASSRHRQRQCCDREQNVDGVPQLVL